MCKDGLLLFFSSGEGTQMLTCENVIFVVYNIWWISAIFRAGETDGFPEMMNKYKQKRG